MRDEGEVGEAALDARLQDGGGPRVAQGRPVLGQQVRELFTQLSEKMETVFRQNLDHFKRFSAATVWFERWVREDRYGT